MDGLNLLIWRGCVMSEVPREVVWWTLRYLGVDEWIVSVIKAMYEDASTKVKMPIGEKIGLSVKFPVDQTQLTSCVEEVTRQFLVGGLLLNASKTEAIAFGTRQQLAKRTNADGRIAIGGMEIVVSDHIKILGVHLDSTLSMNVQVANVAKACNFHIRALRHIRPLLTKRVAQTISYGMVTARLDYCNSLLQGTSKDNIARLQCVQNSLARVVTRAPWMTPSKPLLRALHWLPAQQRVTYKISLLVYKTL